MDSVNCLKFFDSNCMIGKRVGKEIWEYDSLEKLQEEMSHLNIYEALVYHAISKEYDPDAGNRQLLKEIANCKNLHGVWVLTPDIIWKDIDITKFLKEMLSQGVKAVRLFPKTHGYILNKRTCGIILEALQLFNIPVFIDLQEISWKELDVILEGYPKLPVVITDLSLWGDDRYFYPLMRNFKNLYIECGNYRIMGGLEAIRDKFTVSNLIYGSGLPTHAAAASVALLIYSDLSQEDKERIAYGNLKGILEGVKEI